MREILWTLFRYFFSALSFFPRVRPLSSFFLLSLSRALTMETLDV